MRTDPESQSLANQPAPPQSPCLLRDFYMGEWHVQPSLGRLTRHGADLRLRPQLMDVLCCLAARSGQVVGRDKIFSTVWPERFVADTGLARCIAELRQIFGDDAREPTVIETIPKRGYRLLPPVAWAEDDAAPVPAGGVLAHGGGADAHIGECPIVTVRPHPATNVVVLESAVDGAAPRGQDVSSAEARETVAGSCDKAVSGTGSRGAGRASGGVAARPRTGWPWRWITAWLTGAAVFFTMAALEAVSMTTPVPAFAVRDSVVVTFDNATGDAVFSHSFTSIPAVVSRDYASLL